MRECDNSKNICKQQLPIVYISSNNVGFSNNVVESDTGFVAPKGVLFLLNFKKTM